MWRSDAEKIRKAVDEAGASKVILDFSGVQTASRTFMDELYGTVLEKHGNVEIANMPEIGTLILEAVKHTQHRPAVSHPEIQVFRCDNADDLRKAFEEISGKKG